MKKYLKIGISALLIASTSVFFNQAWASTLIASYPTSNYTSIQYMGVYDGTGSYPYRGESFKTSNDVILDNVQFYLYYGPGATATGTAYALIYNESHTIGYGVDSIPTGNPLATSTGIDVGSLTQNSLTLSTFNFTGSNAIRLSALTNYIVELFWNNGNTYNLFGVGIAFPSTDSGNGNSSIDGTTWGVSTSAKIYYVYGNPIININTSGQKMLSAMAF